MTHGRFYNKEDSALYEATEKNDIRKVTDLINQGVNINAVADHHPSMLILAIKRGYKDIVELLLKSGANVNVQYMTINALMEAVDKGYTDVVRYMLKQGVDINARDRDKRTALTIAAMHSNLEVVKSLRVLFPAACGV